MRKTVILSIYISVVLLILSANQFKWSIHKNNHEEPLLNQALAFTPTFVVPHNIDPGVSLSWAVREDSFLQIQKAWNLSQGDKKIVVAIIDTGMDYNHTDLKDNLWKNPKEILDNGIDDDKNGYTDDVMGWDFVDNDSLPYDDHGHGTHVAGIIGAVKGNGIGISGICPNVSLMILKYYSQAASGQDNLNNTVKAFRYAIANGAHIINYSGGGAEFSQAEHDAILEAQAKGILVVAAGGNERQNADLHPYYPASYGLSNIIAVAALTPLKKLVDSSNYGMKIDLAAPGQNIYSTLPKGQYGYMTGTSQATAVVTGIAALALSRYGKLSAIELKSLMTQSTDPLPSLKGKIRTGGVINAYSVLKHIAPFTISLLQ